MVRALGLKSSGGRRFKSSSERLPGVFLGRPQFNSVMLVNNELVCILSAYYVEFTYLFLSV